MRGLVVVAALLMSTPAGAQTPPEYKTLDAAELQRIAELGGLQIVAIEPGNIMASDGKGFPARLSLAGCDVHGQCTVVRIYTDMRSGAASEARLQLMTSAGTSRAQR